MVIDVPRNPDQGMLRKERKCTDLLMEMMIAERETKSELLVDAV